MWAVRFENVSKQFRRGGPSYPSLRQDLADVRRRVAARLRRRYAEPHGIRALDQVSFEVKEGDSVALIGANGAGKSTALRLISRITYPTKGRVRVRGRVGALIEVGSGVHPELTGRENVWLYGSILGIPRREIASRFDEIVGFAELEPVIDTQVKYYSSGMQLRLGFAIAAHLEPEVFVVDEALAVGDASFQAKCVERMTSMVSAGRTLIFVSHSLPVVQELCPRAVLLDRGRVTASGDTAGVVAEYVDRLANSVRRAPSPGDVIEVTRLNALSSAGDHRLKTDERVVLEVDVSAMQDLDDVVLGIGLSDGRRSNLIELNTRFTDGAMRIGEGDHHLVCEIPSLPLLPGTYEVWFVASSASKAVHFLYPRVIGTVIVTEGPPDRRLAGHYATSTAFGPVYVPFEMEVRESQPALADRVVSDAQE
jgi:ABC-type polysaccharide/polyol phosphate transport system ATPase subunit